LTGRLTHGVLIGCLALAVAAVASASPVAPTAAAKRCRIVTKKVHGKKRRVRVCTNAPPAMPSAGTVAARISVGVGVSVVGMAASDDAVWALTKDRRLMRIDPATNKIVATIALPDSEWPESYVAIGDGAVWVTVASPSTTSNPELDSLLRIDLATNSIVARIHVGHSPEGIAVTPSAIWTANHRSSWPSSAPHPNGIFELSRVDPTTNAETRRVEVESRTTNDDQAGFCCGPQGMTAAAGSIWTTDPQGGGTSGLIIRVDPATGAVAATISLDGSKAVACGDMAGDSTQVWFVSGCDQETVGRIDPATNRLASTINVGNMAGGIALGFDSVWVGESGPFAPSGLDRIDPATNKVVARTKIASAGAVAVGAGSIWVASGPDIVRVTPK
jgi:DNA-binding beta-propeller fold protein YncE